jgi:hypothetical protein
MPQGPLIPGLREFDRPKRGVPRWVVTMIIAAIVAVILLVVAGFVGGVGPLRVLGQTTSPLEAVSYRGDPESSVIEVAVTLPEDGLCRDDELVIVPFERSNRVELDVTVTRSRSSTCELVTMGGDVRRVEVTLDNPLGERQVILVDGRQPLTRED